MNRAEFIEEIAGRVDDTGFRVAQRHEYARWVNLAIRAIWKHYPWTFATERETVTTTADDPIVLLPETCQRPKRVVDLTTTTVLKPHVEMILQQRYTPDDTGPPECYCDGGMDQDDRDEAPRRRMRLYPTPDSEYPLEVSFLKQAPSLTLDTHISPLPTEFDEAVVLWCLVRAYRKLEDNVAAGEHMAAYREEMDLMVAEFSVWQVDRFPQVVDTSGW